MNGPLLFVSAGDLSGDNAMARVLAELRAHTPGLQTIGLGGEKLKGLGQEQFAGGKEIQVLFTLDGPVRKGDREAETQLHCSGRLPRIQPQIGPAGTTFEHPNRVLHIAAGLGLGRQESR